MNALTKEKIQKKCKVRGYNIKLEALDVILSFVTRFEPTQHDEAIDIVLDQLEHESIAVKSTVIDVEPVQRVVNLLLEADGAEENQTFASSSSAIVVIDVFDVFG